MKQKTMNRKTLDALGEYADMRARPDLYPRYGTFREAMEDVLSEPENGQ